MSTFFIVIGILTGILLSIFIEKIPSKNKLNINVKDFFVDKKKIPIIITTSLLFYISFLVFDKNIILLKALIIDSIIVIVSFIDMKHRIIPDSLIIFTLIIGLLCLIIENMSILSIILGMLAGGGIMLVIALLTNAIGGGDIKYMFAMGILLGLSNILSALYIAFIIGGIVSLLILLLKIKDKREFIPYAPFLSIGCFISFHFNI